MSFAVSDVDFATPIARGRRYPGEVIAMLNRARSQPDNRIVPGEMDWRRPQPAAASRITATRWVSSEPGVREVTAQTSDDAYVVGLVLRPMDSRLTVAGNVVLDGIAAPGMMHVTEPSAPAQGLFRGPYDALHLHVPIALLDECSGHHPGAQATLRSLRTPDRDPIALQLGLALLKAEEFGAAYGRIYADGISLAIVTRLLALQNRAASGHARANARPLSKWRLRRAIEYVEAHLDDSICLADVAAAAGLSRMHFAAQFKAATGCRPHDYIVRRRVARAQQMMTDSPAPLVDIALQVGFQSQARFTTVFKRLTGQPPDAWRRSRRSSA
jgi:AraC-like DNA-binding protein